MGPSNDRGQLIVVGAVVLAVLLVGVALVLNSAIFAENVSTRTGGDSTEPVEEREDTTWAAETALSNINAENTANRSYPHLAADLDARLADRQDLIRRQQALTGQWVGLQRTGVTRGWRIRQTNHERNFTAGGTDGLAGQGTWSVAKDVQQVGVFEQNVSAQTLYDAGYGTTEAALADSAYHVAIDEPGTSGLWRVYMFQGVGSKNVYLLTEEPDENFVGSTSAHVNFATGSCAYRTTDWVEVEFRAGTFGGAPCSELAFVRDLTPGYDIYYNNTATTDSLGNNVNRSMGTYELFVGAADVDGEPFYPASSGDSPFRLTALYSATYDYGYEDERVSYKSGLSVLPDRLGTADSSVPTVSFSYTYDGDKYHVDWNVADDDGDLDEVEVMVYNNETDTLLESKTESVSGGSASGTTTLDPASLDTTVSYDLYVVVTDEDGVTAIAKQTHEP